uniref:Uncharacterized protein n=1 Tax=Arundo donax TaxID=35708 RepID=A0A0A9ECQ0_ARUDO
MVAISFGIS